MTVSAVMVSFNAVSRNQISIGEIAAAADAATAGDIVIVDNGSTDGSAATFNAWAERFPLLRVIELGTTVPYVEAIERGVNAARGDLLLIVDIDEANQILDIPSLLAALGDAECLHGVRRTRHWSGRRLSSIAFNVFYRFVLGHTIRDIGHNHYLITRERFTEAMRCVRARRLVAFPFAIECLRFRVVQVPVKCAPAGRTSFSLWRRWRYVARIFFDVVRIAATRRTRSVE